MATRDRDALTPDQVDEFLREGVLVVENLLSDEEIEVARSGLSSTLSRFGVNTKDLERTGHNLCGLSSTNGAGGVLDIFYEDWKLRIATNESLLRWTQQLWSAAYCLQGETKSDVNKEDEWKWHPFGRFDPQKAYSYIDRIGYRLPSALAETLGKEHYKGKKRKLPIQRGLTPHLDCCPDTYDESTNKTKWRPIQCFVSLTENLEADTGGFEAVRGFHRGFRAWTETRPPSIIEKGGERISRPAPCVGEYTHIRPAEDSLVMKQVQHVSVRAGSVVFWDNRIPHANAYRHNGTEPRAVVYCSFLPDVAVNQGYVQDQLVKWKMRQSPTDQWVHPNVERDKNSASLDDLLPHLSRLQRQLLGIDAWE